jgi:intein/homing endonuclease
VFDNYPITFVEIIEQPRVSIQFDDGTDMIVSNTHKFLMWDLVWKQVFQLSSGNVIKGLDVNKTVVDIQPLGIGTVVKITVEDAHTYIAGGLISHNVKADEGNNQLY